MRIKLNDKTAQALVEIMQLNHWTTPTHTINVIVSEYLNNLNISNQPAKEANNNYDQHPTKQL